MRLVGRSPIKRARSSIGTLRRSHEDEGRHWSQRGREASRRGRGGCMMSDRLSGKVCVITGTGGSVGRAAALAFAREGASVVGCDVNVAAAEATVEMVRAPYDLKRRTRCPTAYRPCCFVI